MKARAAKSTAMRLLMAGVLTGTVALGGCSPVPGRQGYIADPVLMAAIQPGIDNRQSVEATLGRPTFDAQFDDNTWYYVSRETKQLAFNTPSPRDQIVMRIQFDQAGNVAAVDRTGIELVADINPSGDKTPTLGRERSFFEELFGNIGAVGAPGAAGASNDRTRP